MSLVGTMRCFSDAPRQLTVELQLEISPYPVYCAGGNDRHRSLLGHWTSVHPGGTVVASDGLYLYRRGDFRHGTWFNRSWWKSMMEHGLTRWTDAMSGRNGDLVAIARRHPSVLREVCRWSHGVRGGMERGLLIPGWFGRGD